MVASVVGLAVMVGVGLVGLEDERVALVVGGCGARSRYSRYRSRRIELRC